MGSFPERMSISNSQCDWLFIFFNICKAAYNHGATVLHLDISQIKGNYKVQDYRCFYYLFMHYARWLKLNKMVRPWAPKIFELTNISLAPFENQTRNTIVFLVEPATASNSGRNLELFQFSTLYHHVNYWVLNKVATN